MHMLLTDQHITGFTLLDNSQVNKESIIMISGLGVSYGIND